MKDFWLKLLVKPLILWGKDKELRKCYFFLLRTVFRVFVRAHYSNNKKAATTNILPNLFPAFP